MFIKLSTLILVVQLGYSAGRLEISYNLPNLSACAKWNQNASIFTNNSVEKSYLRALFIDKDNNLFASRFYSSHIFKWQSDNSDQFSLITINESIYLYGLFVSSIGDIYFSDDGVYRWIKATETTEMVAQFCKICTSMFISIHDIIYCSARNSHTIVTRSLHNHSNLMTIVAGVGFNGSAANMLAYPHGIFLYTNLDLYVADTGNHRIQLFHPGQINAVTIAGTPDTIELIAPNSVAVDANEYVYIIDSASIKRIIALTSYGFRCIVSCTELVSSSDRLVDPESMTFDSFGNIYVIDEKKRIKKFFILNDTCSKYYDVDIEIKVHSFYYIRYY